MLPGNIVMTESGIAVVHSPHGFNDLERPGMIDAYNEKDRKPGDICITSSHNYPQLNIIGSTSMPDAENIGIKPQLVWLQELHGLDGQRISFHQLIKDVMEGQGLRAGKKGATREFAENEIDGCNVTDPNSPVRLVQNKVHPLAERNVQHIPPTPKQGKDGKMAMPPANDVGISFPTRDVVTDIDSRANIRKIMEAEAKRLNRTLEWILTPKNVPWVEKRSRIMRYLYRRAVNGGFPE